ncbi:hypothetical protein CALCODRAFT_247087 [Calocera cornea HHB12733]|uniref:Uncharacterized protein n=1 Tax=Calocera cornea HHB12733 TaxID=1353952 RepID=A0A165JV18_9BASI|nr:hypothetical protein CALCODRAFT_247087 [Calocera cornea HHB12733]
MFLVQISSTHAFLFCKHNYGQPGENIYVTEAHRISSPHVADRYRVSAGSEDDRRKKTKKIPTITFFGCLPRNSMWDTKQKPAMRRLAPDDLQTLSLFSMTMPHRIHFLLAGQEALRCPWDAQRAAPCAVPTARAPSCSLRSAREYAANEYAHCCAAFRSGASLASLLRLIHQSCYNRHTTLRSGRKKWEANKTPTLPP